MITMKLAKRAPRSTGDTPPTPDNGRHRRAKLPKYFRMLAAGATVAAAVTMALPASAAAAANPGPPFDPGKTVQPLQIPSVVTGNCAGGLGILPFTLPPAEFQSFGQPFPGQSKFRFVLVDGPGSYGQRVDGDVTFGWFNLTTFQSGIVSGPFTTVDSSSTASAFADTGSGLIVAFAQPRGTATPRYIPGPTTPCGFTPSIGVVSAT